MDSDNNQTGTQPTQDYGGQDAGQYAGGTEGTQQGSGEGQQFGEFQDTNTGTDLTMQMEKSNPDVRSGLIKGGQADTEELGGPARYGGEEYEGVRDGGTSSGDAS